MSFPLALVVSPLLDREPPPPLLDDGWTVSHHGGRVARFRKTEFDWCGCCASPAARCSACDRRFSAWTPRNPLR